MNKNLLSFAGILIIMFVSMSLASADTVLSCNPHVNIISQDPSPAIPDSYVKVVFEISNLATCNGLSVKLNPIYPFSLDPGYNPIQTIEKNPYSPDYKTAWDVPYTIRVAQDALEGDYELKLQYHEGANKDFQYSSFVEEGFNLTVTDVQTDFAVVVQQSSGTQVSLGIVNTGKNVANSLIVGIPQQDNYRPSGTSQQIVGNLAAGDYTIVSFTVTPQFSRNTTRGAPGAVGQAPANAAEQMPKVKMDYTDGIGERRSVVKEVQLSSQGNSTRNNFNMARNGTTTSTTSIWWYIGGGAVILIVAGLFFFKYKEKLGFWKKGSKEKSSGKVPEWVLTERTRKK
jgi:hypothetical protein